MTLFLILGSWTSRNGDVLVLDEVVLPLKKQICSQETVLILYSLMTYMAVNIQLY